MRWDSFNLRMKWQAGHTGAGYRATVLMAGLADIVLAKVLCAWNDYRDGETWNSGSVSISESVNVPVVRQ